MVPDLLLLAVLNSNNLIQASLAYFNSFFGGIQEMPDEIVNDHQIDFLLKS
jgi:hypothetical protein